MLKNEKKKQNKKETNKKMKMNENMFLLKRNKSKLNS